MSDARQASSLVLDNVTEVEVSWPDPFGHALGKRLPVHRFDSAVRHGVGFCDGVLAWNTVAEVQDDVRATNWDTGYPDAFAWPDLETLRELPWRPGAAHVIADVTDGQQRPLLASPRAVLRSVIDELAQRGFTAQVGIELEFYLLRPDGTPAQDALHCYSLEKSDDLEPHLSRIIEPLRRFAPLEAVSAEYGPGQFEVNLEHRDALTAADDAFRLRYGLKALARREGLIATFMAKPFSDQSGSSSHLHVSLWRGAEPAFAAEDGREPELTRHAIAGVLGHLPGIALFGAPTVNSYKRFTPGSFAPTNASWGGDNRTVAIRSLIGSPAETRIEVRTPASDATPYLAVASVLAAIVAGLDAGDEPPAKGDGNQYGVGDPLPRTLGEAIAAARADGSIAKILGDDVVHDLAVLSESEWTAFLTEVTTWEQDRYLRRL